MKEIDKKIKKMLEGDSEMRSLGKTLQTYEDMKKNLHLDLARKIQVAHREAIIGGSLALFLHGVRLDRWGKDESDLDLIVPHFILIDRAQGVKNKVEEKYDFDYVMVVEETGIDVKIDNKAMYEVLEFEGFMYKVSRLDQIWAAKCKYSIDGNEKHTSDLNELCGKPKVENKVDWDVFGS